MGSGIFIFGRGESWNEAGSIRIFGTGGAPFHPSGLFRRGGLLGIVLVLHGMALAAALTLKPAVPAPPEKPLMVHFIEPPPEPPRPVEIAPEPLPLSPPARAEPPPEPTPVPKPVYKFAPKPKTAPPSPRPPLETTESDEPAGNDAMIAADPEPAKAAGNENTAPATGDDRGAAGGAVTGARFDAAYLNNPAPPYPPQSRRLGEEGKVILRVLVSKDGDALEVDLDVSSGSGRLDESALRAVRRWKFVPARRGGAPVESRVLVPILFKLEQ
ncbi:MAG: energy transducer TonB [Candidatus Accumulibacter sp.]|jgi:protein TonB|nr:energy transducer TonB [Accumulibacter sp.]